MTVRRQTRKATEAPWPETLWTIGHSTRSLEELLGLLRDNGIEALADVRHYPGSRKYPHFNVECLRESVPAAGIAYESFTELGGRRKVRADSPNTAWRHPAFRGYADFMDSGEFHAGIERLKLLACRRRTAIMCAEAVWWRCHRSLISDVFKLQGTQVLHIMGAGAPQEHPYTSAAHVENGKLDYAGTQPGLPAIE